MNEDYLYKAVENVRRKSAAALESLSAPPAGAASQAVGVVEPPADIIIDVALIEETQRTLEMAAAALEEIRNSHQKESN